MEIGVEARRRIYEENFFGRCGLFSLLIPSKAGELSILPAPQVQEEELSVRGWRMVPTVGGARWTGFCHLPGSLEGLWGVPDLLWWRSKVVGAPAWRLASSRACRGQGCKSGSVDELEPHAEEGTSLELYMTLCSRTTRGGKGVTKESGPYGVGSRETSARRKPANQRKGSAFAGSNKSLRGKPLSDLRKSAWNTCGPSECEDIFHFLFSAPARIRKAGRKARGRVLEALGREWK